MNHIYQLVAILCVLCGMSKRASHVLYIRLNLRRMTILLTSPLPPPLPRLKFTVIVENPEEVDLVLEYLGMI